jgi:hypothetical protein
MSLPAPTTKCMFFLPLALLPTKCMSFLSDPLDHLPWPMNHTDLGRDGLGGKRPGLSRPGDSLVTRLSDPLV